jgi:hypothetical protein
MLRKYEDNKAHIVRFPKDHDCDEKDQWKNFYAADHHAYCPECCGPDCDGPGRGKMKQWSVVYGKEIFYVNFGDGTPKYSKI